MSFLKSKHKVKMFAAILAVGIFLGIQGLTFAQETFIPLPEPHLQDPDQSKYDTIIRNNKIIKTFNNSGGGGVSSEETLKDIFQSDIILIINVVIGAIALIWIAVLATKFISSQGEEEKISTYKKEFGMIILGLLVVSVAQYAAFNLADPTKDLIGTGQDTFIEKLYSRIDIIVTFIQFIIGGVILIVGGMSAYRMVTSGDNDEKKQAEKTFFKSFILGVSTILLSEVIVRVLSLESRAGNAVTPMEGVNVGIIEVSGIIRFILTFIGISAFLLLLFGIFTLVISFGRDDMVQKAKKMIIYSIVAIIIAILSFSLTSYIVANATIL